MLQELWHEIAPNTESKCNFGLEVTAPQPLSSVMIIHSTVCITSKNNVDVSNKILIINENKQITKIRKDIMVWAPIFGISS